MTERQSWNLAESMTGTCDIAIVGAGPYGLSIAAHLRARGADLRIFGTPLSTWRTAMPEGMLLKSDGFASNLSAPAPNSSLADYCRERELPYHPTDIPVPRRVFVDYGLDFQRRFVPDLEEQFVTSIVPNGRLYRLALDDGQELDARRVILACGITHFAVTPEVFAGLPEDRVSHSNAHHDFAVFADKDVTVIGAGASAVNSAVALTLAGARARLVLRAPSLHFSSPPAGHPPPLASRLRTPPSGLGPGWRSRVCCDAPGLFRYVPARWRPEIVRRHLGPSSPWHLQPTTEASVEVLTSRAVRHADASNGKVRLELAGDQNGPTTTVETDHVICSTGYRADIERLTFLDASIRTGLKTLERAPVLSRNFESSVPGLYFVGLSAAVTFGPLMRFMHGDAFVARRISAHLTGQQSVRMGSLRPARSFSAGPELEEAGSAASAGGGG
jgi:cation diffusion facilitator CzcD-associated flavoprotein CzcO